MTNQDDEKAPEGKDELSLDDLEEVAGGFILDAGNGRYLTVDKPGGSVYYRGRSARASTSKRGRDATPTGMWIASRARPAGSTPRRCPS